MLKVTNVTKSYRKAKILKGITFEAPKGMYCCVVGQNGSGKSTLLQILSGMSVPDSGEVTLNGNPARSREAAREIGYVPQIDSLFGNLSAKDNIAFWASASSVSMRSDAVEHFTQLLGISSFWKRKVRTLSGGERRRVAICVALLHNPACIMLDEPFTGLDLVVKDELFSTLDELCSAGKTILYTTHNIDEVRIHGKLILLREGVAIDIREDEITGDFKALMLNLIKGELSHE